MLLFEMVGRLERLDEKMIKIKSSICLIYRSINKSDTIPDDLFGNAMKDYEAQDSDYSLFILVEDYKSILREKEALLNSKIEIKVV